MVLITAEARHGTSQRDDQASTSAHLLTKIEYLESQLQAYKVKTSLLQQEHLSALDTLNEIKETHKEKLEQERNATDVALSRLQKVKDRLRAVEAERDDYKEVVLQLIERVERSHGDFKHWPYSKLQLSNHVGTSCFSWRCYSLCDAKKRTDSLLKEQPIVDDTHNDHAPQHTAYSNGLVHSLKRELYLERQAHALTRARINILSAQVASRDAALEGWVQQAGSIPTGGIYAHCKGESNIRRDLDRSEISALYDQTAANNRLLEQEIHALFQYAEETRQKATQLAQHSTSPHFASPSSPSQSIHPFNGDPAYPAPLSNPVNPVPSDRHSYHIIRAIPQARPPTTSPTSRRQSPSHRSHVSPSPHRGRSSSISYEPLATPSKSRSRTRSQSRHHPSTPRLSLLTASPPENVVQDLSEQVRLLSIQIDGLRAERVALSRVIHSQRDEVTVTPDILQKDSSFDSSDTDGDQSFVGDAETDGEHGTGTLVPEEHPNDVQLGHDIGIDDVRDEGSDGNATEGGERSMEIATPLISTLITFPDPSSEGDNAPHGAELRGEPGVEEDQGDGQIKMIRPRRGASVSPPMPP